MSKKKAVAVADFETDPFEFGSVPKVFCSSIAIAEEEGSPFRVQTWWGDNAAQKLADFIESRDLLVYFHNGGRFDIHFILDRVTTGRELSVINGRIASCRIGKSEVRDSWCILPAPLKSIQKDDIDITKLHADRRREHMEEIIRYNQNDCIYLLRRIIAFHETYGQRLTLASSAFAFWQNNWNGGERPKTRESFDDYYRQYYFGGRVQAFIPCHKEKVNLQYLDINSAYPFAMLYEHPFGTTVAVSNKLPPDESAGRSFLDIVTTSHGVFPILENNALEFPDDGEERTFRVTGWEYLAARNLGRLGNVKGVSCRTFTNSINFQHYVEWFYKLKSEAKDGSDERLFAKLFLNSLYGKFGMNPREFNRNMIVTKEEAHHMIARDAAKGVKADKLWRECSPVGTNKVLIEKPAATRDDGFINVAVSASITGFVRAMIANAIFTSKGRVFYCDTDSIMAEGPQVKIGEALGQWKVEAHVTEASIAGPKLYVIHGDTTKGPCVKMACKGGRLTPEDIERVAAGEAVKYQQAAPSFSLKRGTFFTTRTFRKT